MTIKHRARRVLADFLLSTLYSLLFLLLTFSGFSPLLADDPEEVEERTLERFRIALVPDKNIDLAETALIIARTVYPEIDVDDYLAKIDLMAEEISMSPGFDPDSPPKIIQAINNYLYRTKKAQVDSLYAPTSGLAQEKFMLNKVVDSMKGNCLGFSTLYLALAERLDLPLSGVDIPQHVFLRYDDGDWKRNIETTSGGREITEKDYIKKTKDLIGDSIPEYSIGQEIVFRKLSKRQFIALILYNRGVDYYKNDDLDKALRDFGKAIALDDENTEAYKNRATVLLARQSYKKAVPDLHEAVKLESDCPATYYHLGLAYSKLDDPRKAIRYFNQAIDLAPDYAEVYQNRAVAYHLTGETRRAFADIGKAIELCPQHAPNYYTRGWIYTKNGEMDEAIEDYSRAISLDDKCRMAYLNRGVIYFQQEKLSEAISDFEKTIELSPQDAEAYYNLAITYYKMGDYEKALDYIVQFSGLIPPDSSRMQDARNMIKDIKRRLNK